MNSNIALLRGASMAGALLLTSLAAQAELLDLCFDPASQEARVGDVVEIHLIAASDGANPQEYAAIDAILSWDESALLFLGNDDSNGAYSWFFSGFLPDPDGINDDLEDGDALYTALARPEDLPEAPPGAGMIVTTFKFMALAESAGTVVSFIPEQGEFGRTRVLLGADEITGDISCTATVVIVPDSETICPDDAADFLVSFGGPIIIGDAADLCDADDVRLQVRQRAQVAPVLPFIRLEFWAHTTFADNPITALEYRVEGHVSALVPGGQNTDTLRTWIRNYDTGLFELVDIRATGAFTDEVITHVQAVDAPDYVQAGDGEIRVRQDVFNPGDVTTPNWFLKVDQYTVLVSK